MRIRRKIRKFRQSPTWSVFVGVYWALVAAVVTSELLFRFI